MKKILLGTSALLVAGMVSASANAAPVKLSVGGYANWYTGYVDANNALEDAYGKNYEHVPVVGEAEIHFKGETVLQNGLKFGAVIELTSVNKDDSGADEDQSYIYADTAAGRFTFGKIDSISKQLHKSSKDVGLLDIQGSDVGKLVPHARFRSVEHISTDIRRVDDEATIAYFSPKFAGFTVAASYSNVDTDATHNTEGNDVAYSTVVAYNNTFGKVTLDADVGYTRYDKNPIFAVIATKDVGIGNIEYEVNAGFRVGVAGFSIGGGYKFGNGKDRLNDAHTFDAGVAYENGPYGVSLSYINENMEVDLPGREDLKTQMLLASFAYEITDGVKTFASLAYVNQKGYIRNDWDGYENANTYVIATGLGLTF